MNKIRTTLMGAALAVTTAGAALADTSEKLVTVVTSENPQTQLMAMVLTTQAVMEHGAEARILLCGPGGDLALRDAPETATAPQPPRDASPQGMLQNLMNNGVTVEVCAIYLPGMGAEASVLLDGVGVAQPPAMAGAMLDQNARVWSF